jgi:hypothetical protein
MDDQKKAKSPRKLELNRESVRQLTDRELAGVAGGAPSQGCSNNSCVDQKGGCKEH